MSEKPEEMQDITTVDKVDIKKLPRTPDPFWPPGAAPTHLSRAEQENAALVKTFQEIKGPMWKCQSCGATLGQSTVDSRYCYTCYDKQAQNTKLAQRVNSNWMDEAKELGLEIFERQPEETNAEWAIWQAYRSYYPLKLPTWTELAKRTGHSVSVVTRAAAKWSYKVRLVAWARFTDDTVQEKRIAAIKEMNKKQLSMAQVLQDKLKDAIDTIDPALLKPNEIVNLFKVATEMERKITTYVDEKVASTASESGKKQIIATKPEDLGEVLEILQKTGVLNGKTVGIEQTTRIIAKEEDL